MLPVLAPAAGRSLVLDLRSGAYAAMWQPGGELAERTVAIRVLHERTVGGVPKRSVVSHFNKATKGRLVRALLEQGSTPSSPAALADVITGLGWKTELGAPGRHGQQLDVVVEEL